MAIGRISREVTAGAGPGAVGTGARSFAGFFAGREVAFFRGAAGVLALVVFADLVAFAAGRRAGTASAARRAGGGGALTRVPARAAFAAFTTRGDGFGVVEAAAGRRGRALVAWPSCEPRRLRLVSSSPSTS